MNHDIHPSIRRFSDTLALAIYDCELERHGTEITYYYDADVVYSAVMGLELGYRTGSRDSSPEPSEHQLLVRALLSCGFLGPFHMLRPHAYELMNELQRRRRERQALSQGQFRADVHKFLISTGVLNNMQELDQIISRVDGSPSDSETDIVAQFFDALGRVAGRTFARIEQCNGTWEQRIRRYRDRDLFRLDRMGPSTRDLSHGDKESVREINMLLIGSRAERAIQVYQDALALAILHSVTRARDEGHTREIVRFYSETPTMRQAIETTPRLRELLSYTKPISDQQNIPAGAKLVFRDSRYFVMRAWFETLRPGNYVADQNMWDNLRHVSKELSRLLRSPEEGPLKERDQIDRAIEALEVDGIKIRDLVERFENLAIMDYIWTDQKVTDDWKSLPALAEWAAVFRFAESKDAEDFVFEEIQDILEQFSDTFSGMKALVADYQKFLSGAQRARAWPERDIQTPLRDFGLIRWVYDLDDEIRTDLRQDLHQLLEAPGDDQGESNLEQASANAASRLATQMVDAAHDLDQGLKMCAILWSLSEYERIISLAEACLRNVAFGQLRANLLVIKHAALLRTGQVHTYEERKDLVDRTWDLRQNQHGEERTGISLGIGDVLFHAWKLEQARRAVSKDQKDRAQEWARNSFAMGERWMADSVQDELARVLAINHCAYVGLTAGVEPIKTDEYVEMLLGLEPDPALWSARFDNTLGVHYLLSAERLWDRCAPEERKARGFSRHLQDAREHLSKAKKLDIGDMYLAEHLHRLDVLQYKHEKATRSC
jgi:hypothetical protein